MSVVTMTHPSRSICGRSLAPRCVKTIVNPPVRPSWPRHPASVRPPTAGTKWPLRLVSTAAPSPSHRARSKAISTRRLAPSYTAHRPQARDACVTRCRTRKSSILFTNHSVVQGRSFITTRQKLCALSIQMATALTFVFRLQ